MQSREDSLIWFCNPEQIFEMSKRSLIKYRHNMKKVLIGIRVFISLVEDEKIIEKWFKFRDVQGGNAMELLLAWVNLFRNFKEGFYYNK